MRAGGIASIDLRLPSVALIDVWTPRASLGADVYADRFSSTFFSRSTNRRDAEPPGNGIADPAHARLVNGQVQSYGALTASLAAEGQRTTLWADGKVAQQTESGGFLAGEIGARAKLIEELSAYVAASHVLHDDTVEAGADFAVPWFSLGGDVFGSSRDALPTIGGVYLPVDTVAYGVEARASLRPGFAGLRAFATFAAVVVDDGALFSLHTPGARTPNPAGTVELDWDPPPVMPAVVVGFFSRARFQLPQQHLAPSEQLDPALCPELPTPDQRAAGVVQSAPCSGASGAFLFDLGAHVDVGAFRVDGVAENLLDQQGALRDEPIGFGGTSFRALLTLAL